MRMLMSFEIWPDKELEALPLASLDLPKGVSNPLRKMGITTLGQYFALQRRDMLGFGPKKNREIAKALKKHFPDRFPGGLDIV